jgi:DNA-binding NtrC family response regulator
MGEETQKVERLGVECSVPEILVVDDEENQRAALASMVRGWGYLAETAGNGAEALEKLKEFDASVIVSDLMMPEMDGMEMLRRLREQEPAPPVIILTAFGNMETALKVVHDLGAYWFLEKPLEPAALRLLLERATAQRRLEAQREILERQLSATGVLGALVGGSPAMQEVYSLIRQVAPTKATILVTGESGTGKELVARAIHELSPRSGGPFVAVNCAAMPESLMESELFGHEKGAFTGAVEKRVGCFELAKNGTLLLDEIADMPLATQAKLLRVLEDRKVRRLGSPREMEVDVRVVASTNHDLEGTIKKGAFREDLYFRLNVFRIALPALRERMEDLPALSEALVRDLSEKHASKVTHVEDRAMDVLRGHTWPGNVRELRNVLERAVILCGEGGIQPQHLAPIWGAAMRRSQMSEDEVALRVGTTIEAAERELIEMTLRHTGNNRTRAAAILGITTKTLFNKLKDYGESEK